MANKGTGVWEVATRYSHVDMDDNNSSKILGGVMDNYTRFKLVHQW